MKCPKLKTGQRVQLANGKIYMVIMNFTTKSGERQKFVLTNRNDTILGDNYEDSQLITKNRSMSDIDIIKIFDYDTEDNLFTMSKCGNLLWERTD